MCVSMLTRDKNCACIRNFSNGNVSARRKPTAVFSLTSQIDTGRQLTHDRSVFTTKVYCYQKVEWDDNRLYLLDWVTARICRRLLILRSSFLRCSLDVSWSIFIARQHTDARYWYSKSVRPSVCLSVRYVPVLYENGLTYCHDFSTVR